MHQAASHQAAAKVCLLRTLPAQETAHSLNVLGHEVPWDPAAVKYGNLEGLAGLVSDQTASGCPPNLDGAPEVHMHSLSAL